MNRYVVLFIVILAAALSSCTVSQRRKSVPAVAERPASKPTRDTVIIDNEPFMSIGELIDAVTRYAAGGSECVEVTMTGVSEGWFCEGQVMRLINAKETIHSGKFYTYTQLDQLLSHADSCGISVVPMFDLAGNNRFKEVTGHEMMSVEGVRFVCALLDEFFSNTGFENVILEVPSKSNLRIIRQLDEKYPEITFIYR